MMREDGLLIMSPSISTNAFFCVAASCGIEDHIDQSVFICLVSTAVKIISGLALTTASRLTVGTKSFYLANKCSPTQISIMSAIK